MGRNADLMKSLYQAFGRGDVKAVLDAFDPQIRWMEAEGFRYAGGNPYDGPGAVVEGVFQRLADEVDGFTVNPQRFFECDETVITEGRYRGTVKSTGSPVDAQFAHVWTIRDGKVAGFQQYTDTKQWSDSFGD